MSEETQTNENDTNDSQIQADKTELEVLKGRAKMLGITFSNNIKVETLREKIKEKLEGTVKEDEASDTDQDDTDEEIVPEINALESPEVAAVAVAAVEEKLTPNQIKMRHRQAVRNEALRLIRVRITCLDPKKKSLHGEILTVANETIGTVRKFVPYGEMTDNGYHIPYCLFTMLQNRKFLSIQHRRDARGREVIKQQWVREFAIEVLDPLTPAELQTLANQQAASGSVESEEQA